jgi:hypothetical protein
MFTPKQVRQGTDIGADGHNTAVDDAGPMVAPPVAEAMAVGMEYSGYGKAVFSGASVAGADLVTGETFVWDSGLAIADQPGEAGDG